jgi:Cd2+/Zn2+-exporting ATPase
MTDGGTAAEQHPKKYRIAGMDCGNCALTIESSLLQLPGVEAATVSFTTETMEVVGDIGVDAIAQRLTELGYRLAKDEPQMAVTLPEHRGLRGFVDFLWSQPPLRRAVFVAGCMLIGLAALSGRPPFFGIAPLDLLFAAGVLIAGGPVFVKGIRAMLFARRITIDLLMAIASTGALAIGATGEAITVILLFMLGEALEAYSAERARNSLRSMMALQPQEATVLRAHAAGDHEPHDHGDGHAEPDHSQHDHQVVMPVDQVCVGDRVLIRPGQRVPVDGEITKGVSSINQAPLTGEDMPVVKSVGDELMAGTVNGEAALEVRVTKIAADGTIARIAKLVEQAQAQRSPAERFIDRFARWYTPAVVLLAGVVVAIPVLAFGQPLLDSADGVHGWLYRGLAMLIIACPCALVISIPVTVVSGLTRLANLGVLVKSGAHLDRLADIRAVAFDKTGTLTHGRPTVSDVLGGECEHPPVSDADCESCDDIVGAAAAVERSSEHPVAGAIVGAAALRNKTNSHRTARSVRAHPGLGVCGELGDGTIAVGNRELFDANMDGWDEIAPYAENAQHDGQTVMYVARDKKVVGYIGVRDEIRQVTGDSLRALAQLNPPILTVMLTGDSPQAAKRVVDEIGGISEVRAGLMPEEKLAAIEDLHDAFGPIAMVGDGINDAPALARADVGIAMGGGGTAQAMETADVVLMQDDLSHVPMTLQMARKSRRIIKENIALSLGLKLAFLALAIPGLATLWMAVLADVGATLIVTLNGMRLLRK